MKTLHIAPDDSAGGALREAIRDAGGSEEVLSFCDDLSCGPIHSDDPSVRAEWWSRAHDVGDYDMTFWDRVMTSGDRLVVWFGRHCAQEFAFFLAWTHRLGDRPYSVIDVTGAQWPYTRPDGSAALTRPAGVVGIIQSWHLRTLLGSDRPLTAAETQEARAQWRRLREENAPFRVVTPAGMASAPANHFDPLILERATREWQTSIRVIGLTMAYNWEPYMQVGDVMLLERVVALIGEGKLLAEGDARDMHACRVRLPG